MSTDMHSTIQRVHKHSDTLSYPWTYLAPLLVHSPHSLSMCERGGKTKDRGGQCKIYTKEKEEKNGNTLSSDCTHYLFKH